MTHQDFNQKYAAWLAIGAIGLEVTLSHDAMSKLDSFFKTFIEIPHFKYISLKYKDGKGYFSAIGIHADLMYIIEQLLTNDK